MRVYLCGPINGCGDAEANDWRRAAGLLLGNRGIEVLDPMRRDYRGLEDVAYRELVEADVADIDGCDALLVNAARPSWGTAMEVRLAWSMGMLVVAFLPTGQPVSPWLRYHTRNQIATSLDDAVALILA